MSDSGFSEEAGELVRVLPCSYTAVSSELGNYHSRGST